VIKIAFFILTLKKFKFKTLFLIKWEWLFIHEMLLFQNHWFLFGGAKNAFLRGQKAFLFKHKWHFWLQNAPNNHHPLFFALSVSCVFSIFSFIRIHSLVCSWIFQKIRSDFQNIFVRWKNHWHQRKTNMSVGITHHIVIPKW